MVKFDNQFLNRGFIPGNRIYLLFIWALMFYGCSDDSSLTIDEYYELGVPSIENSWSYEEYFKCFDVLDRLDIEKLPNLSSRKSKPLFLHMVDHHNFDYLIDTSNNSYIDNFLTEAPHFVDIQERMLRLYGYNALSFNSNIDLRFKDELISVLCLTQETDRKLFQAPKLFKMEIQKTDFDKSRKYELLWKMNETDFEVDGMILSNIIDITTFFEERMIESFGERNTDRIFNEVSQTIIETKDELDRSSLANHLETKIANVESARSRAYFNGLLKVVQR